jgi:indole-3-glycerol phosphate synthase/phosphoribosylanthranilate isomerase
VGRFADALRQPGLATIAEIKRRSPSAGDLRPDADPAQLARSFEQVGAAAVSILVDERFGGSWEDLRAARAAASLPVLAKGFFSTRAHLETARASGADAALLILRDLDDAMVRELLATPGLDFLVEAHDARELKRAEELGAEVIGVNARDLSTFKIDRRAQLDLVKRAPRDRIVVAESGIENRAHIVLAELAGAHAILVGTALMRAPDPASKLAEVLRRPFVKVCGLTRQEDVSVAAEAGADLAGFVLAESPRRADTPLPVPDSMLSVGVFVGAAEDVGTDLIQLYPEENGHRARDGGLFRDGERVAEVIDLPWLGEDDNHLDRAAAVEGRVLLAGGLGPENVRAAIERAQPWAVDASRSLESAPGIKDHSKMFSFAEAVRER